MVLVSIGLGLVVSGLGLELCGLVNSNREPLLRRNGVGYNSRSYVVLVRCRTSTLSALDGYWMLKHAGHRRSTEVLSADDWR